MKEIKLGDFMGDKGKATASTIRKLETGTENLDVKIQRLIHNYNELSAKLHDSLKLMMIGNVKHHNDNNF